MIAGIVVSVGVILQVNLSTDEKIVTAEANSSNVVTQPQQSSWHLIATYSGGNSNVMKAFDFNSTGQKVKVTISAKPLVTYNTNKVELYLQKELSGGRFTLAKECNLSWGSTESPNTKKFSIEDSSGSKTYNLQIIPTDIEKWTVKIWDYY